MHAEKAKRINRVKNDLHSEEELIRRLPEIDAIYDEELRECVIQTFYDGCPDYFWQKPTSSSGKYHSPDERGKHGNLLHTKRVFAAYCNLSESYLEAHKITEWQREAGKAAALLHDMMKYGWPSSGNEHTVNDHDIIAAEVARHIGDCPNEVYLLIHSHMGSWAEGMMPQNERQWLLHFADKSASGIDEDDLAVYYPSEELQEEFPDLNVIDHDSEDPV
jgi:hypothetical protein